MHTPAAANLCSCHLNFSCVCSGPKLFVLYLTPSQRVCIRRRYCVIPPVTVVNPHRQPSCNCARQNTVKLAVVSDVLWHATFLYACLSVASQIHWGPLDVLKLEAICPNPLKWMQYNALGIWCMLVTIYCPLAYYIVFKMYKYENINYYVLKYRLKRCVLRWRLKAAVSVMCQLSEGREFHTVGPATENNNQWAPSILGSWTLSTVISSLWHHWCLCMSDWLPMCVDVYLFGVIWRREWWNL